MQRQFNVTPHRPLRHTLVALLMVSLVVTSGWMIYQFGRERGGHDRDNWSLLENSLRDEIDDLNGRNAALIKENAVLQRSAEIDRNAYKEVQKTLADTQTEMLELHEQLSFYRGLVTPSDKATGLQVQAMEIKPSSRVGRYEYRVTLVQVNKNDRFAVGQVDLQFVGTRSGRVQELNLSEVGVDNTRALEFKFKYFQYLEGVLILPRDFRPQSIDIDVKPRGKRLKPISVSFDWQSVVVGGT